MSVKNANLGISYSKIIVYRNVLKVIIRIIQIINAKDVLKIVYFAKVLSLANNVVQKHSFTLKSNGIRLNQKAHLSIEIQLKISATKRA